MRFGVGLDAEKVRASGITLKELQSYTTDRGASVLVITDPTRVQQVVEGIWEAPPMANAYSHDSANCNPIPDGAPSVATESPTPKPAPADLVPTEQGEVALPEPVASGNEGG
jgi:hypothetical protein